jgi:hypothetical protein
LRCAFNGVLNGMLDRRTTAAASPIRFTQARAKWPQPDGIPVGTFASGAIARTTKELDMTDHYQKDLDNAAKDRDLAQAELARERMKADEKFRTEEIKADKQFVKEVETAEDKAMNRDPITGSPGSHPVGTGVGTAGGMVAGAAVGTVAAGPLGTAVGGLVGALVGAAAGHSAGEAINPTVEETYWRDAYVREPYFNASHSFDDYAPAYRAGYMYRNDYRERSWEQAEPELQSSWEDQRSASRLRWEEAREAARAAWYRADQISR